MFKVTATSFWGRNITEFLFDTIEEAREYAAEMRDQQYRTKIEEIKEHWYNDGMKKIKYKTFDYSPIALRALTRHKLAPPTKFFTDRKKQASKAACRLKEHW